MKARLLAPPEDEQFTLTKVWKAPELEADFHAIYGVEFDDIRDTRSGPWLRKRVESLPLHPNSMVAVRIRAEIQDARKRREEAEKR